jgi:hypothetical protein
MVAVARLAAIISKAGKQSQSTAVNFFSDEIWKQCQNGGGDTPVLTTVNRADSA